MAAKRKRAKVVDAIGPTPEQAARGAYELGDVVDNEGGGTRRIGKAYRRVRMVEQLHKRGVFTDEQARALRHYRHHADLVDRSPVRDSLNFARYGGSGMGPSVSTINAMSVVRDCEAAAKSLRHILRAVIVDDMTLTQWAIKHGGAIEDVRIVRGVRCSSIRAKPRDLNLAALEIRMAAICVMSELDA